MNKKTISWYLGMMGSVQEPFGLFEPYIWKDKLNDSMWHCEIRSVDATLVSVADKQLSECLHLAYKSLKANQLTIESESE